MFVMASSHYMDIILSCCIMTPFYIYRLYFLSIYVKYNSMHKWQINSVLSKLKDLFPLKQFNMNVFKNYFCLQYKKIFCNFKINRTCIINYTKGKIFWLSHLVGQNLCRLWIFSSHFSSGSSNMMECFGIYRHDTY